MDRLKGVNTVSNNSKGNNMDKGSRGKGSNNSRHQVDNLEDLLKVMGKVLDNLEAALLLALDNNRYYTTTLLYVFTYTYDIIVPMIISFH